MPDPPAKLLFGVDVDDVWRYTGRRKEPGSIILPHLLSFSLPVGSAFEKVEESYLLQKGESPTADEVVLAAEFLASNCSEMGVDYVRCWFPWNFFEPTALPRGELAKLESEGYPSYPFDMMLGALERRSIELLPVLACGYKRMLPGGLDPDRDPGGYIERAALHASAVVRHYKSRVKLWQIENEPNWWEMHTAGGWRAAGVWLEGGTFRTELLTALNEAVHSADPAARTMVNLEADEDLASVAYYSDMCDTIGLDYYPNYKSSSPVDASVIGGAAKVHAECGRSVMIAETGYPSGPELFGYTQSKQAEYIRRACVEALKTEGVAALGIWRFQDSPWRSFPEQENHFGLLDAQGTRKQAFDVYRDTIRAVKGTAGGAPQAP